MSDQPELLCTRCQDQAVRISDLEHALRTISQENSDLADELKGARATLRTLERQLAHAKASRAENDDEVRQQHPKSQSITAIYEVWISATGRVAANGKPRAKLTKERWDLIQTQLGNHDAQDLIRAIKGAALLPYVRYGKRYLVGDGDERETQLEHCIGLKPAGRVEKNVDYYRRACRSAAEQKPGMLATYERITAHQQAWAQLVLDAAVAVEKGVQVDDLEQLLWDRYFKRDAEWATLLAAVDGVAEAPVLRLVS
jgi:hypothetical protein